MPCAVQGLGWAVRCCHCHCCQGARRTGWPLQKQLAVEQHEPVEVRAAEGGGGLVSLFCPSPPPRTAQRFCSSPSASGQTLSSGCYLLRASSQAHSWPRLGVLPSPAGVSSQFVLATYRVKSRVLELHDEQEVVQVWLTSAWGNRLGRCSWLVAGPGLEPWGLGLQGPHPMPAWICPQEEASKAEGNLLSRRHV